MKRIITYGTFDMLHIGHINLLARAKARGDYLIVGVTSDDYDRSRGKLAVDQSEQQRMAAIQALDFVDEVILETHKNQKQQDIIKYKIDEFVIGDDWVGFFDYLGEWTKVVYLPRTPNVSSTQLRNEQIKPIRIGIVGVNSDSRRFLRELKFVDFISAHGVYDADQAACKDLVFEFDLQASYQNYAQLLAADIDAVYICGDICMRYEQSKLALQYGKHVLCENSISTKQGEAEELFALAQTQKKLLLLAIKTAFAPAFNKLLEQVANGVIGTVKEVRCTFTSLYHERGFPQRFIANGATNLLMNYPSLLIHKIAGASNEVLFIDQHNGQYDISNRAITRHANDVIGIATVGIEMKSDGNAIIAGSQGYAYVPAPWWLTQEFYLKFEDTHKEVKFEYEFAGDGIRYLIAEFAALIRQQKLESSRLTIADMLELNKIVVAYNARKSKC